jgi:hypothetical protein
MSPPPPPPRLSPPVASPLPHPLPLLSRAPWSQLGERSSRPVAGELRPNHHTPDPASHGVGPHEWAVLNVPLFGRPRRGGAGACSAGGSAEVGPPLLRARRLLRQALLTIGTMVV